MPGPVTLLNRPDMNIGGEMSDGVQEWRWGMGDTGTEFWVPTLLQVKCRVLSH